MAYGNTLGMSYEDFDKYLQNKKAWETGSGPDTARANFENSKLREKYGISGDNQSYSDLMMSNAYYNPYTTDRDKSVAALGNYTRYKDPYNTNDLRQKLDNFVYNPENDPNFQVYRDMYARQGQAAQGQTLANLTAISGGRNNSWASAATAQVGQAYAQKTADMIPQLAQQAYNKLLQRYNIEAQESDRAYGRWIDQYGRTRDMADLYNTLGQQEMQNKRQRLFDEQQYGMNELDRQIKEFGFSLERQWAPAERAINIGLLQQALLRGEIELEALPEQIRLGLEQGYYNIEQVKQAIAKGEIELKYLPAMYEADIAATNRSNRVSAKAPTQYQQQQAAKGQILQILYPSNLPSGISETYYPIQQLAQFRASFNAYVGKDEVDNMIITEAAKIAQAEGKSYNEVLYEQGFSDLVKY